MQFFRNTRQSGMMINIADKDDSSNVQRLPYEISLIYMITMA